MRTQNTDVRPQTTRRTPRVAPASIAPIPVAPAPLPAPAPIAAEARSSIVAQKIIQLQEWLAGHKTPKPEDDDNSVMPIAVGARPAVAAPRGMTAEEKRVGWTD